MSRRHGVRALLVAALLAGAAPALASNYQGRPLSEALLSLQRQGLAIVFTSRLVRPEMTVVAEPASREPRRILDEILAPHGLAVEEGPGGVLVVVAKKAGGSTKTEVEEEAAPALPVFHDEIVVQPSRVSLLNEQPESSLSLSREDIETLPHLGGDVFRTTSLLPGVAANDVTARFSVHGGRRDEVAILLDGQELYDAFHLKDYDSALSFVPARALASATLTTGAYPASRGDRMSGVLDLRTADPPAGRRYVFGLSVFDALASSAGRFAEDRGAWLLTARRGSLALARDAIGNEDPQFWDVLGKLELATDLGLLGARILTAEDDLGINQADAESFDRFDNRYRSTYVWLTHQAAPGKRLLVETLGSWAGIRRRRGGVGGDEEGSFELRDRRHLQVLALAQTWSLQLASRHALTAGIEARRYDAFFDYANDIEPAFVILAPFAPPRLLAHQFNESLRSEHLGLWASDLVSWRDRLTAELGLRYDRHTATRDKLLSPRVNLAWRQGERSVVRAAWGRFFQSQRPYELQVEDGESALRPAERSEHWVLGYETLVQPRRLGLDAVRVELFRRRIEEPLPRFESLLEPLNFFPEIEPDRVRITPKHSTAQGLEILLRGSRGERLGWWLAYSYARAEDRLAGRKVPRPLDQPHTLALDLDYRPAGPWSLNLAWRYHTGWPTTPVELLPVDDPGGPEEPEDPAEPQAVAVFGPPYSQRFPPYHRLDLRASRLWSLRSGRLTFFVDVQNLYNRRNLSGFDVHPGDDGEVVLDAERWPGIFPSAGITWEF
ncbi:MAG TPA: TonB-dependent receptor [Thermoanaerobaculia bacterium]